MLQCNMDVWVQSILLVQEAASTRHAVTGTPNRREPMERNYFPFFPPQKLNNDTGLIGKPEETKIRFQFAVSYIYESLFPHTVVWLSHTK